MLDDVSEIIWRGEIRFIYIDVCNLTIPRRPAACSWVVCFKNKPSYRHTRRFLYSSCICG